MRSEPQNRRALLASLLLAYVFFAGQPAFCANQCASCGAPFTNVFYSTTDKLTEQKTLICSNCMILGTRCFLCSLPAKTNLTELADGRVLCARDAQTAVLDEGQAKQICGETRNSLDRLFSRFMAFPETNVTVSIVDRVHLQSLFKSAGQDSECPNVWGYHDSKRNRRGVEHAISLLSALPDRMFKATCAHEYGHAWLNENLSERRKRSLGQDAKEGFCELLSFLLMDANQEEAEKKLILRNTYTRGQIHLFIAAEHRYGFNDIVDWMKSGTDSRLTADDLGRVRNVEAASSTTKPRAQALLYKDQPAPVPDVLTLKGILWAPKTPQALINDRAFAVNEQGKVRVGKTNVAIRCLAIRQDGVRIQLLSSGQEQDLPLKSAPR